jgi:murein DD-endopeptidase MepM/ murein hydrolase activator NlpD
MRALFATLILLMSSIAAAAEQNPPLLSLPIACSLGKDCFIQQYVDVYPGSSAKDYRCGKNVYNGHKGTDFRLLSVKAAEANVAVLAAAAGRVKAVRDGMPDKLVGSKQDIARLKGRDCGNGVVLDHDGGWETQYCHLKRGSIKVRKGQSVAAGAPLGYVGYSGNAAFAHVHLSVRQSGQIVDPFLGAVITGACRKDGGLPNTSLWRAELHRQLEYQNSQIIETGFASGPVSPDQAELGDIPKPTSNGSALVFFVRLTNVRKGDRLRLIVAGPGGFATRSETKPLNQNKATYVAFAGKRLRATRWPPGSYSGIAKLIRGGKTIRSVREVFELF